MKSAEGKAAVADEKQPWESDIQAPAVEMLKTIVLLERAYGADYLSQMIRGMEPKFGMNPEHSKLETYGSLKQYSMNELRLVLSSLELMGYVAATSNSYNTFKTTDKGIAFLDNPHPLYVDTMAVRFSPVEFFLLRQLSDFRSQAAKEKKKQVYEVFSNHSLDRIVKDRPDGLVELRMIPGMTHQKADEYGEGILEIIKDTMDSWEDIRLRELERVVQHYTHQKVLEMYRGGHGTKEIARTLGIAEITAKLYLADFHMLGTIDLQPEIEGWVSSGDLYRASEYFRHMSHPNIQEASKALGINYYTARLCQAYAAVTQVAKAKIPA